MRDVGREGSHGARTGTSAGAVGRKCEAGGKLGRAVANSIVLPGVRCTATSGGEGWAMTMDRRR